MPRKSSLFIRGFAFEFYNKTFYVDAHFVSLSSQRTRWLCAINKPVRNTVENVYQHRFPDLFDRIWRAKRYVDVGHFVSTGFCFRSLRVESTWQKRTYVNKSRGDPHDGGVRETQALAVQYTVIIVGFDRRFSSAVRVQIVTCSKPLRVITKRVFIYTRESTRAAINATTINHTRN